MYAWLWHRLPGGRTARLIQSLTLLVAAGLLLWYVVYPWASVHLPLDQAGLG